VSPAERTLIAIVAVGALAGIVVAIGFIIVSAT
jgi:hypothetical protein